MPFVEGKYKTGKHKILGGHSIGGLFIMNTALNKPNLFNQYIAISPALWWENNAINEMANQKINNNSNFDADVYVSLADEKGMGIDSFLATATGSFLKNPIVILVILILCVLLSIFWFRKSTQKLLPTALLVFGLGISAYLYFFYYPTDSNFKFKHFPQENHNSVGSPTYVWALKDIFSTWKVDEQFFTSAQEFAAHNEKLLSEYGTTFNIQNGIMSNTIYILQENPEELKKVQSEVRKSYPNYVPNFNNQWAQRMIAQEEDKEAEELLKNTIKEYPDFFDSYNILAKLKIENENFEEAEILISKAMELAKNQNARQWKVNELEDTRGRIIRG